MSKITVLGLGAMGSRLAANYAAAGHEVTVWNRTRSVADELAAIHSMVAADTPRSAVTGADFVVSMLADDAAALEVWSDPEHGAFDAMSAGATAIESSTLMPDTVTTLADAARTAGVGFVEAPVVGSRPQAEAGALLYLLGGADEAISTASSVIGITAGNTVRVGPAGHAAMLKLAINGLFAAQVAAYAEIVGIIERSDLDTDAALGVLSALPITSPGLQRILGLIGERSYDPNFPIRLVAKDLASLGATARSIDVDTPIMDAASAVFRDGAAGPLRELDISGIALRYQSNGGAARVAGLPIAAAD